MDSYDSLDHIHLMPYSVFFFFFLNQLLCVLFLLALLQVQVVAGSKVYL